MESLPLVVLSLLSVITTTYQFPMEKLDDILVYPVEPPTNVREKRDASASSKHKEKSKNKKPEKNLDAFIEEKLIQHTQALEHLVKMVHTNEELTKTLLDNLSKIIERPELPEKVEVLHPTPSQLENEEDNNFFARISKNLPLYGNLVKNAVIKQANSHLEPVPIVESDSGSEDDALQSPGAGAELLSRRSNGPVAVPSLPTADRVSPWCRAAMGCKRSLNPVCGFDDNFGYGKFDDVCHMLQVNCYWKYNFDLAPNCRPKPIV